ncbi:PepSY domain-containing protein [Methylobacterium sp. WL103]|nr:PepSY domain-containing protein [Methylobacterium sp. WL103]
MFVSLRTVLFRLHWALGLTAGLVLALVGVTGAMMSYEEAILDLANADRAQVAVQDRPVLGPEALVARNTRSAKAAAPVMVRPQPLPSPGSSSHRCRPRIVAKVASPRTSPRRVPS